MKNIFYTIGLLLLFIMGLSCKRNELITYQGQPDIYFNAATRLPTFEGDVITDSINISFAYSTVSDSVSKIVIGVAGAMADQDRDYKLIVNPASTAIGGQHYDVLPATFKIKRHSLTDTLFLKMHRTADLQKKELLLILDLEANENFVTKMKDKVVSKATGKMMSYTRYKVYMNDIVLQPSGWFDPYLGKFSRKKLFLMVEVLNVEPSFFVGRPSLAILTAYGKYMQRYLNDLKIAGKTVYEDDGSEMIMGSSI